MGALATQVLVALSFGVFLRTLCGKRIQAGRFKNFVDVTRVLPYTAWLLLFGVILGIVNLAFTGNDMASSIGSWQNIEAHVILFVFLPALLFQASFSTDVHIMRHESLQIFCLAVPGVLLSTFLTGIFTYYFVPSFSWNVSFLLGAILSATDPVAVVALLKDMGVDERLGVLIEGESLMNDGSAIVLYTIIFKMIMFEYCCDPGQIVAWIFRLSLGGPALGLAVGLVVVRLLDFTKNDMVTEITLTLVAAYSCFFVAEGTALKVSGVLAVVFCGLYLSEWAVFSAKSEKSLKSFWVELEFVADTIIFVASGLIVSRVVWSGDIGPGDWGFLFVLYVVLNIIRFINVLVCWPILKSKHGYGKKWDYKEMLVLVWGGLRGAVGLSLALIAESELGTRDKRNDEKNASLIVFYMAGIAFLTLVINGSLVTPLIHHLKLDRVTTAEQDLFHHSCARVELMLQHHVDEVLKTDAFLGDAQYQLVWRYVPGERYCPCAKKKGASLLSDNIFPLSGARAFRTVLSPHQYWLRIDTGKIHLLPHEVEDALNPRAVGRRRHQLSDEASNLRCPPRLRGTWDRYHREFAHTEKPIIKHVAVGNGAGTVRTQAVLSSATPRFDQARGLEKLAGDLKRKLVQANIDLKLHRDQVTRADASRSSMLRMRSLSSIEDDNPVTVDMLQTARTRFMTAVRAEYVANHHMGRMLPRTLRYLRESADQQLDYPEKRLQDWEYLEHRLDSKSIQFYLRVLQRARNMSVPVISQFLSWLCKTRVFDQLALVQEVASEFVYARSSIDLDQLLDNEEAGMRLHRESECEMRKVIRFLHSNMEWPEIANALKTRTAARQLLMYHSRMADELLEHGDITEREVEILLSLSDLMVRKIEQHPIYEAARSIESILIDGVPGPNRQIKLPLMEHISGDEIRAFLAQRDPQAVLFKEVFVRPHKSIFKRGQSQVSGIDDQTINGRRGWFVVVRGMVTCSFDANDDDGNASDASNFGSSSADSTGHVKSPRIFEPGSTIGLVEQLLGHSMKATYKTSSYCHLIFMDASIYLKEASPHVNDGKLYRALFREMARQCLPELLGFQVTASALDEASFVDVIAEEVQELSCASEAADHTDFSGSSPKDPKDPKAATVAENCPMDHRAFNGHSTRFTDLDEYPIATPIERSFSWRRVGGRAAAEQPLAPPADGAQHSGLFQTIHRHVVTLDRGKWYLLLRGSIIGRCTASPEMEQAHTVVESIRKLAEGGGPEATPLRSEDFQQLDSIIQRLIAAQKGSSAVPPREGLTLIRGGVDGRVRVSGRTVLLQLPNVFKACQAASRWLQLLRSRQRNFELHGPYSFGEYDLEGTGLGTPRDRARVGTPRASSEVLFFSDNEDDLDASYY